MSMEQDLFAEQRYGKIALKKIAPTDPNFRLFYAGWLGENGESDIMEVRGAVFRVAKSGVNKGTLCILVPGTQRSAHVTAEEMDAFKELG